MFRVLARITTRSSSPPFQAVKTPFNHRFSPCYSKVSTPPNEPAQKPPNKPAQKPPKPSFTCYYIDCPIPQHWKTTLEIEMAQKIEARLKPLEGKFRDLTSDTFLEATRLKVANDLIDPLKGRVKRLEEDSKNLKERIDTLEEDPEPDLPEADGVQTLKGDRESEKKIINEAESEKKTRVGYVIGKLKYLGKMKIVFDSFDLFVAGVLWLVWTFLTWLGSTQWFYLIWKKLGDWVETELPVIGAMISWIKVVKEMLDVGTAVDAPAAPDAPSAPAAHAIPTAPATPPATPPAT